MGHHHGSHTPTSPEAVLLHKQATLGKHFEPECTTYMGVGVICFDLYGLKYLAEVGMSLP